MISVIVPSYNSAATIERCLSSLLDQTYVEDYEILLVDSSVDRTPQIVGKKYPRINLIHFDKKTDPGSARNEGIRRARGDLLLFIDSDCEAESEWIEKLVKRHRELPDVPGIGGGVENGNGKTDMVARAGYIAEFREFIPEQPAGMVSHLPTLNISYKKWVFEKHGLFDPHYYPQEDLELNFRVTEGEKRLYFDPGIRVRHRHRSSFQTFCRHQKQIGWITSQVLKILPLPGATLVHNKALFIAAGPFLPFIKFFRTVMVFLKLKPLYVLQYPGSFAMFKIGILFWFAGFWNGVFAAPLPKPANHGKSME